MSTAPTGGEASAAYTSDALVARWVPSGYKTAQLVGGGPSNTQGKVSIDDITEMIQEHSRAIDARLWTAGVQTPFPDVASTTPPPPKKVIKACTFLVASDIRMIMKFGSRQTPNAKRLAEDAEAILEMIEEKPATLGLVYVTQPEDFTLQMISGTREAGLIQGPWYRLKNLNCVRRSLRFVTAAGKEALRPEGFPYIERVDWSWIDAAQGVVAILNTQIIAQMGAGGGAVYSWSWCRLDRFNLRAPRIPGVAR